jgi:hypothetical protein
MAAWVSSPGTDSSPRGRRGVTASTSGAPLESAAAEPLRSLLGATILTIAGRPWSGRDLVTAGTLSGRWPQLEDELALGLAALRDWTPPSSAVNAAVRDFRYAARLISADEFSSWMHAHELSLAEVVASVQRRLARERAPQSVSVELPAERDGMVVALPAEAICTGALKECGTWLIDRVLSLEATSASGAADTEIELLLRRERTLLAANVLPESESSLRSRASLLLSADAAYQRRVAEVCSERAIAGAVRRHALDWSAFELESFPCPSIGAADEVAALLRERTPLELISELSGVRPELAELRLEEAPNAIQGWLSGAHAGAVSGPLTDGDTHRVWLVQTRRTPDPHDPEVRQRACAEIIEEYMRPRRAGKVKWHERH